jgi:transposase, IS30 family
MSLSVRHWLARGEQQEVWSRWKEGQAFSEIGRALGKTRVAVREVVEKRGGLAPRPEQRRATSLRLSEREEISRGIASGDSIRQIARRLGRAPSSISRELARNTAHCGYRAYIAERNTWQRARRPKVCLLARHPRLRAVVIEKLRCNWSPEQISGYLVAEYADDKSMRVSHETIYRTLYIQARGVLKKELIQHLRTGRRIRRAKAASARLISPHGQIFDAVRISERPAQIEDRAVPGHWEGDLIVGSKNSQIATLVERQSRFTMLVKTSARDSRSVVNALSRAVGKLPVQLRGSLTWDRGVEMAEHKRFTVATDVQVYFCDPQSPWQRGSNENTNGLLRQYFPKGQDLSGYTQAYLDKVARELNQRPRKTLGFRTPADQLEQALQ